MEIRNECTDPPPGILRHVRRALGWINQTDLAGIDYIQLLDTASDLPERSPEWLRQAKEDGYAICGTYVPKHGDRPAHIALYAKDLYRPIFSLYERTPLVTLRIGHTLAHEVGHHLQATRGY